MVVIADASAVLAFLLESGEDGNWAREQLNDADLAAPSLMWFEVANTLRRHATAGLIETSTARRAHAHLLQLSVAEVPYGLLAVRAWELRNNFTIFDASYIALAEMLEGTLVTLDARLARGPGIRCDVAVFESGF